MRQDVRRYARTRSPGAAAAVVVVCGAVMTILDSTIVNVAIERLAVAFDSELATIQWVSTGYLLALVAVIPSRAGRSTGSGRDGVHGRGGRVRGRFAAVRARVVGRLADRVPRLQGLGGGLVMPVGMTILARAAGPDRMGRVMALVGVPMLLAPAIGPALGGALIDGASWRWIFFVNLPVAVLALVLAARVLPRAAQPRGEARRARGRAVHARPGADRRRVRHAAGAAAAVVLA